MRAPRLLPIALAFASACVLCAGITLADEKPGPVQRLAWFSRISDARKVARETGRPILVALHVRPRVASPEATMRFAPWLAVYRDPEVISLSRRCACVMRVLPAPEGRDPDVDQGAPAATHLVIDVNGRVLARLDGNATGDAVKRMRSMISSGLRNAGPVPEDAPLIGPGMVARAKRDVTGASPMRPVQVPLGTLGVRLRLRWELPSPALTGSDRDRIKARVRMRWDGEGPFDLGGIEFGAGEELDLPVDVRFEEIEGLKGLLGRGLHRVDLYLEPESDSFPFSQGPLHVGRVWIELGEGGGGGAAQDPDSDPDEEKPSPPQPTPPAEGEKPEPPPPPKRTEVVDPFVREGETIKKEDAVVAVEDPDGAVKPPRRVPLEQALRDFEKIREREVGREGNSPRDRDLLRRYFERLLEAAKRRGRAEKK